MSQAECSRHRGLNRSSVSRLVSRGILVMRGRYVDVAASDAVLDDQSGGENDRSVAAPSEATDLPASRPAPEPSYAAARTADKVYQARLRRLEFEARQGKLIDADAVRKQLVDAGRSFIVFDTERAMVHCAPMDSVRAAGPPSARRRAGSSLSNVGQGELRARSF